MKKNNSVMTRIMSFLLCILIVFTTGPSTAIANDIFDSPDQNQELVEDEAQVTEVEQNQEEITEEAVSPESEDPSPEVIDEELSEEVAETQDDGEDFVSEEETPTNEEEATETEDPDDNTGEDEVIPSEEQTEESAEAEEVSEDVDVEETSDADEEVSIEETKESEKVEKEEVQDVEEASADEEVAKADVEKVKELEETPKTDVENEEEKSETPTEKEEIVDIPEKAEAAEEYPAATLTAYAGDIKVTLVAPEGSLPKGTQLRVEQVGQEYIDAVAEALEEQGRSLTDAVAIDVTPVDKDGNEVQPKKLVAVTFSGTDLDLGAKDAIDVFYVSDDAETVTEMTAGGNADKQTFVTNHFTIFVTGGSVTNQNNDPSGTSTNTESNPYVLAYGDTIELNDDDSSSSNNWRIASGAQYATLNTSGGSSYYRTKAKVTNNNTSTTAQIVHITHGSNANRHFYIRMMPQVVTHDVTFMLKDAGATNFAQDGAAKTVNHGESVTAPSHDAEKTTDGKTYVFDGWYTNEACTTKATLTNITADMTVYAKYDIKQHTVTFMLKDAASSTFTKVSEDTIDDGGEASPPAEDASKEVSGKTYSFSGWFEDQACTQAATFTNIKADKTYYAKYDIDTHKVQFWLKDAGATTFTKWGDEITVSDGSTVLGPDHPENKKVDSTTYTFKGWFTTEDCDEDADLTNIKEDKNFYAKYDPSAYDVVFKLKDAGESTFAEVSTATIEDGEEATAPTEEATKKQDGVTYTFDGWYEDEDCTEDATLTGITEPKTFYAKYDATAYDVIFKLKDAGKDSFEVAQESTVTAGGSATAPDEPDTKKVAGLTYDFDGWCTDEDCSVAATDTDYENITETKTFYAKYVLAKHTVTYMFKDAGETSFAPDPVREKDEVTSGEGVTPPTHDPIDNYEFQGWFTDENLTEEAHLDRITNDIIVYARYAPIVKLTYHKNSGTDDATIPDPSEIEAAAGTKITLGEATRTGHDLMSWTTEADGGGTGYAAKAEFIMPEENVDLFAQWRDEESDVTVTYYWNHDDAPTEVFEGPLEVPNHNPHYTVISDKPILNGKPYLFIGWATSADGVPEFFPNGYCPVQEENVDLFAIWAPYDKDVVLDTKVLHGTPLTVTYDGEEHYLEGWSDIDKTGNEWMCPVEEDDNPKTSGYAHHKYAGYVRVGDYAVGSNHHHVYAYVGDILNEVKGTNAGTYTKVLSAKLYTHNDDTDDWTDLGEVIDVEDCTLIIKPVEVTVSTGSDQKLYDGDPLTKGGTVKVGNSSDEQSITYKDETPTPINLLGNDKLVIWTTGSQREKGSSDNTYEAMWGHDGSNVSEENKDNYIINDGTIGKLTVYMNQAKYDKNSGSDTVTNMPANEECGKTYTLSDKEPERTHYQFKGWNTKADGSGDDYAIEGTYTFDVEAGEKEVTFYAQWELVEHTVTFDPNGGEYADTTEKTDETYNYGAEIHLPTADDATKEHYHLIGWQEKDGDLLDPGAAYTVTKDTEFTAEWEIDSHTVIFDPNGGEYADSEEPTEEEYEYGTEITLPTADDATREHYQLVGWQEKDGDLLDPGAAYTVTKDTEFTAEWKIDQHTLSFALDGGKYGDVEEDFDETYDYGTHITLPGEPEKEHYSFQGWEDENGTIYEAGANFEVTEDMSFTALWKIDTHTITYDPNGGEFAGKPEPTEYTHDYGETIKVADRATRDGYEFEGWLNLDDLDLYEKGNDYKVEGDTTFKALWRKILMMIYDPTGGIFRGTEDPTEVKYLDGDSFTISEAATWDEYHDFVEWNTAADGSGDSYTPGDVTEFSEPITFYAIWEHNKHKWDDGEVTTEPTCTEKGVKTYHCTIDDCEETKTEDIDPLGHDWGEWKTTKEPTCTDKGEEQRVCKNDEAHVETKDIDALGHDWGEPTYTWSDDNSKVTAKRVCAHDAGHVEEETAGTSSEDTKDATCDEKGQVDYTSVAFKNDAFKPQKKSVETPALGHEWSPWEVTEDPIGSNPGEKVRHCLRDSSHTETSVVIIEGEEIVTITYDPAGGVFKGSEAEFPIQYNANDIITIAEAPERDGYEFLYWKGSEYQPGDKYTVVEDHIFVAQWKQIPVEEEEEEDSTPEENAQAEPKKETPKKKGGVNTGDEATPMLWALLLVLSALLYVTLNARRNLTRR